MTEETLLYIFDKLARLSDLEKIASNAQNLFRYKSF